MAEKNRIEGQLWIDRKEPHGLKYHTDGATYQLTPEKVYGVIVPAGAIIPKGSLVAINGVNSFKLAQFPKDIDRVVGICPIDLKNTSSSDIIVETSILKNGNITLAQNSAVFEHTDVSVTWSNMVGAPVYWFIGRSYFNGTTSCYIDPQEHPGELTLATPSGIRWGLGKTFNEDNSLNVGYSNLPTVGTVVSVDNNNVTINVSISKFESELEWHWPYCMYYLNENTLSSTNIPSETTTPTQNGNLKENILSIRHGLFCKSTNDSSENFYAFRPRSFCNVLAMNTGDDTEHVVFAGVDNYYGDVEAEPATFDKRTDITFKNYDGKRIYVSGKVVYTFDKQHN